jgi:serine/threonine protein kinase
VENSIDRSNNPDAELDRAILNVGTQIATRYTIEKLLGRGGNGIVYLAKDSRPPRNVALKFISSSGEKTNHIRFMNEARLVASLNHANIIQIYEIGESGGREFISMEFVDGGSLAALLQSKGQLPLTEACAIMRQVGEAVSFAHRNGIIHRDLKPANILLTKNGVPKLSDFGLAKSLEATELSIAGTALGTLGFMSPEQRKDSKSTDKRTDIYSWGATFYQLVTGRDPLSWDPEKIPTPVSRIIKTCLSDLSDRFLSMDDALASLKRTQQTASPPSARITPIDGNCPSCDSATKEDSRFCESCGFNLFENCLKCNLEARVPIRFCRKCGCDVPKERSYRDYFSKGKSLSIVSQIFA